MERRSGLPMGSPIGERGYSKERLAGRVPSRDGSRKYRYAGDRKRRSDTYFEDLKKMPPKNRQRAYDTMVDKIQFRLAAMSAEYDGLDDTVRQMQRGLITEEELQTAFDVFANDYGYVKYLMERVTDICGKDGIPCPLDFADIERDIDEKYRRVSHIRDVI